jgi:hypothetical protein
MINDLRLEFDAGYWMGEKDTDGDLLRLLEADWNLNFEIWYLAFGIWYLKLDARTNNH